MANEVGVGGQVNWEAMFLGRMGGGMQFLSALSELVDNSLDAHADMVHIKFQPRSFELEDNGDGAPSLEPFFGFGIHQEHARGRRGALGIWGVGGTHAILYLSGEMTVSVQIDTRTRTNRTCLSTNWKRLAAKFNAGDKITASQEPNDGAGTGTRIQLVGNIRKTPNNRDLDKLTQALAFRYSKALSEGAKIIVTRGKPEAGGRDIALKPYTPPTLTDTISDTFEVNGKRAAIMVGIVPQGTTNERPGLHYRYSYRVIEESSAEGCGEYSSARIFGFVDLLAGWRLDLHKDGVTDKDAKQLHAEVFARIEPLLKQAQSQLMLAESAALLSEVERRLSDAIAKTKKAKRGRGNKKGTKKPSGNGTQHASAENKQPGTTMPGENGGGRGVHVGFADLDSVAVGDFRGNTVRLNTSLESIRRYRTNANADALFVSAMFVYWLYHQNDGTFGMMEAQAALINVGETLQASAEPSLDGKRLDAGTEAA